MAPSSTVSISTYNEEIGHDFSNIEAPSRHEIQAAIAKAAELRALHASLLQGGSSDNNRLVSTCSPTSRLHQAQWSAHDYPVFTPSYEDEPLPGFQSQPLSSVDLWEEYGLGREENGAQVNMSKYRKEINVSSRKGLIPSGLVNNSGSRLSPPDDARSVTSSSCTNNISMLKGSPAGAPPDQLRTRRRNSMGDLNSVSSCNKCQPATISSGTQRDSKNCSRHYNMVVPLTDTHASMQSQSKSRGPILSWLFPKLKKKNKKNQICSPLRTESEEVSQILKDIGTVSVETLKKELIESNQKRDAALSEVSDMRSSFGDLKQKLESLESYCDELKRALKQTMQSNNPKADEKSDTNTSKRGGKSVDGNHNTLMPVSDEVMVEGFLQIVSESRLSVKNFSKALVEQIDETDSQLSDSLNSLLQPYKLSLSSRYSKAVLYHLEAIINRTLYQDFENCVFQKDGSPKYLDPQEDRRAQFSSFVSLRNLSWNEVLSKGTKYYSEEFSKFCDQKMSCIITTLNWMRPWPEELLQSFFVAAKCIWLLHLLAFSFKPPLTILRVSENKQFDAHYMDDIFMGRQKTHGPSRVKIMVMPGFYVQDRILRCKVICRYKNLG